MRPIRTSKGFTLPEATLSLVLLAVIAGTVGAVLIVGMNIVARNAELSRAQLIGDGVYDLIAERLTYGRDITVTDGLSDTAYYDGLSAGMLCIADGELLIGNSLSQADCISAFSGDFFGGMTVGVTLSYDEAYPDIAELTVEVFRDTDAMCSRSGSVRLLNCGEDGGFVYFERDVMSSVSGELYMIYTGIGGSQ